MKYLTNVDLNKNELQNAVIQPLATAPSNPKTGQIYYNSSDKKLYQYNGTAWVEAGSSDSIKFTAQTLTDAQKAQARANIGAGSAQGLSNVVGSAPISATVSGSTATITHDASGVSAGTYGSSATADADAKIARVTVNATGHTTGVTEVDVVGSQYITGLTSDAQDQIDGKEDVINVTANRALVSNASGGVGASAVTATELGYVSGVTSAIQTQLNSKANASDIPTATTTTPKMDGTAAVGTETKWAKGDHVHPTDTSRQATITGAATTITSSNLTANRALVSNGSGKVAVSDITSTELGYLDGVTSNIQTQLNGKVTDVQVNNVSKLDGTVAKIVYETGLGSDSSNAATVTAIRAFVNSSIENVAAYYITSDTTGNAFATKAALDAGPWYYAGATRTPTRNDYAIVIADETHSGQSARYTYVKADGEQTGQWAFQYTFNMTFTAAQLAAINSGITAAKVGNYDAHLSNTSNPHSVTVGQIHAVSYDANQGLTTAQQGYARANIGAGTSSFSGSYNDLTNKPTIPTVNLNGSATTSPSFYAPTSAGTSGQVLTSNGSGAPTWQASPESVHKYTATNTALTASSGAWTWTIASATHGITNNAMFVALYEVSTGAQVIADITVNQSTYAITITIVDSASAGTLAAGTYRVVAIG